MIAFLLRLCARTCCSRAQLGYLDPRSHFHCYASLLHICIIVALATARCGPRIASQDPNTKLAHYHSTFESEPTRPLLFQQTNYFQASDILTNVLLKTGPLQAASFASIPSNQVSSLCPPWSTHALVDTSLVHSSGFLGGVLQQCVRRIRQCSDVLTPACNLVAVSTTSPYNARASTGVLVQVRQRQCRFASPRSSSATAIISTFASS